MLSRKKILLIGSQLSNNFSIIYWIWKCITVFTGTDACSYPKPDKFSPSLLFWLFKISFNIILPSVHRSSKWFLPFRIPHQIQAWLSLLIILEFITLIICAEWCKPCNYSLCDIFQFSVTSSLLGPAVFHSRENLIVEEFLSIRIFQKLCKYLRGNL